MTTKEPQYRFLLDLDESGERQRFGLMSSGTWLQDPKRLAFLLSRYKFVARMLDGADNVLEIGCADGFGSRIVRQAVQNLTATDFDPVFIADAERVMDPRWPINFTVHDILAGPLNGDYDAIYALDVLEHIDPAKEQRFLINTRLSLSDDGVCILGMPSLESQKFASPASIAGHVNCQSGSTLQRTLLGHFRNVFMFSMNDEVVHTGFMPMAHYLMAVCVSPRRD